MLLTQWKVFPGRIFSALIYFCIALSMLTTVNLHVAGFQLRVQRTHRLKKKCLQGMAVTLPLLLLHLFFKKAKPWSAKGGKPHTTTKLERSVNDTQCVNHTSSSVKRWWWGEDSYSSGQDQWNFLDQSRYWQSTEYSVKSALKWKWYSLLFFYSGIS